MQHASCTGTPARAGLSGAANKSATEHPSCRRCQHQVTLPAISDLVCAACAHMPAVRNLWCRIPAKLHLVESVAVQPFARHLRRNARVGVAADRQQSISSVTDSITGSVLDAAASPHDNQFASWLTVRLRSAAMWWSMSAAVSMRNKLHRLRINFCIQPGTGAQQQRVQHCLVRPYAGAGGAAG